MDGTLEKTYPAIISCFTVRSDKAGIPNHAGFTFISLVSTNLSNRFIAL
jgi:hypothetical protein